MFDFLKKTRTCLRLNFLKMWRLARGRCRQLKGNLESGGAFSYNFESNFPPFFIYFYGCESPTPPSFAIASASPLRAAPHEFVVGGAAFGFSIYLYQKRYSFFSKNKMKDDVSVKLKRIKTSNTTANFRFRVREESEVCGFKPEYEI